MALVTPNDGEILMLKYILNMIAQDGGTAPAGGHRLLRLFTNNLSPSETTALGDITEASGSTGYLPVTLTGSGWTISLLSGDAATGLYSEVAFPFTTRVTLYGYYVTTIEGTPKLLWLERFTNGPYTLVDTGGEVAVTPTFSLD